MGEEGSCRFYLPHLPHRVVNQHLCTPLKSSPPKNGRQSQGSPTRWPSPRQLPHGIRFGRPRGLASGWLPSDEREPLFTADVIDNLQDTLAEGRVLDFKLLAQAAVIDQVVPRAFLATGVMLEGNPRLR